MKEKRRDSKRNIFARLFHGFLIFCMILSILTAILVSIGATYLKNQTVLLQEADMLSMAISDAESILYHYEEIDRERVLCVTEDGILHGAGWCIPVSYEEIPQEMINALIAIEDKRFFTHTGVDFRRTFLAGLNYFLHFDRRFGASTLTQQLVKNLTGDSEQTPDRKLREMITAYRLEEVADKTEILEAYLNTVNFAQGCRGVGAAARRYFGKEVGELTLSESASLIAIANNPSYYDPILHPDHNQERRDLILSQMAEQGYITAQACALAQASVPDTANGKCRKADEMHSWYTDMVIADVIHDLCVTYGYSESYASFLLYYGGLRIETCMDPTVQKTVETYFSDLSHFPKTDGEQTQCAVMIIDPLDGRILGVAGGVGEKQGDRVQNLATDALHPVGSVIKPLSVYAPALELGKITWSSVFDDSPICMLGGKPWPANANHCYRGETDISTALLNSTNTVAVRVLVSCVGVEGSFSFLHDRLGMEHLCGSNRTGSDTIDDKNSVALALGQLSRGVTLREITGGYTVFYDGIYRRPHSYYRVFDAQGNLLLKYDTGGDECLVLSRENAAIMTQLLRRVARYGTKEELTLNRKIECAGKTGTTQNSCDRWFIGYTPELLAGVWIGHEYPRPMDDTNGNPCLHVWNDLMQSFYASSIVEGKRMFSIPDNLIRATYCQKSGELASDACAGHISTGFFVPGTEPRAFCHECEQ